VVEHLPKKLPGLKFKKRAREEKKRFKVRCKGKAKLKFYYILLQGGGAGLIRSNSVMD
jgi:hypothetical protein